MADYDGTTARLYNNGALLSSGNKTLNTENDSFYIGGFYDIILGDFTEYFGGKIAEIIVYDSVLSNANRSNIFNYLNGRYAIY